MRRDVSGMLLLVALVGIAGDAVGDPGDAAQGRRLYQEGITAAGHPVEATLQGDVAVSGAQFSCAGCHRPSGMGSSEGGVYVPPITAQHLFAGREMNKALRNERFKELFMEAQPHGFWSNVRMPRTRPAYDADLLRRAVVDGLDASGRPLAPIMPRFRLGDEDVRNLEAYLRQLSDGWDPGVSKTHVHLATVVAQGVAPKRRDAFLSTARAYVDWMNRDTTNDLSRGNFSPYYRTEFRDAYRQWTLHVWELRGARDTWPEQLAAYYREQPVFAVVSGLVPGPWQPVAQFCDRHAVPCLFPNTRLPDTGDGGHGYTLHFNRGLELEGQALAGWLARNPGATRRVIQIHVADPMGRVPAGALASAAGDGSTKLQVQTREVDAAELGKAIRTAAAEAGLDTLVIWPGKAGAEAVAAINASTSVAKRIVLSSTALEDVQRDLAPALSGTVRVVSPYETDAVPHPRRYRVRAWMRSRRLAISDWRMQSQTFYAFTVLQYGLEHLLTDFHRDYLVEIIEHEAENDLNPGIFPSLALGPGQRFASKGAYVVQLQDDRRRGFRPDGEWIVPD